ncbi:hypothetical protein MNV49_007478 [Pseudohyphozyma bogoriensis]|nr:hypothetical protein MNV49_007478 [Pseudohyphozyma bogoriensis]
MPNPSLGEIIPPTPATSNEAVVEPTQRMLGHRKSSSSSLSTSLHSFLRKRSSETLAFPTTSYTAAPPTHATSSPADLPSLKTLMLGSRPVRLTLINQTGFEMELAKWPVVSTHGELGGEQCWKGEGIVAGSIKESGTRCAVDEDIGTMKRPPKGGFTHNHHTHGWIFFDLLIPSASSHSRPYKLHCQLFLQLSSSGSALAELGRFDLDSTSEKPMPSGSFGRVEVHRAHPKPHSYSGSHSRSSSASSVGEKAGEKDKNTEDGEVVEVRYFLTRGVRKVRNEVDDSTKSGSVWVPTKGMVVSSWCSAEGARVSLLIHHGDMISTRESRVLFDVERNLTINLGFFDSGMGRSKQAYVYVSHRHTHFLADLIDENPRVLEAPFEQLALAGSHDAGILIEFLSRGKVDDDVKKLALAFPFLKFVLDILKPFKVTPNRILENMANTQKDLIKDQLEMGVRFFDFRPGYCIYDCLVGVSGDLHHQHAIVNGVQYISFLCDILNFLADNPKEIVFFEIKNDGFVLLEDIADSQTTKKAAVSMVPTIEKLASVLDSARASSHSQAARDIVVGTPADLSRSVGDLISSNTRLIIADRVHYSEGTEGAWERADSYTHEAYDTDDPSTVLVQLEATYQDACYRAVKKEGPRSTIYQCQATPTAKIWADVGASLTYSDASSLLVWSKSKMDRVTYPWIAANTFLEPGNVIFLNDFVDGALVEHAVEKTRERIELWLAKRDRPGTPRNS